MKRVINLAATYQAVEAAKSYTNQLREALENGRAHTLKVGPRIYQVIDGGIDYHSENGNGRYHYPKTWRAVYDYILRAIKSGYMIEGNDG